jgi:hypothetical protein
MKTIRWFGRTPSPAQSRTARRGEVAQALQVPERGGAPFVIPSEARNLSSVEGREKKERFLASLGMTKQKFFFRSQRRQRYRHTIK